MPRILTDAQVQRYQEPRFVDAVPVLTPEEVREYRADLERYEAKVGHPLDFPKKSKSRLLFDWADRIVYRPKVLDAVEDVIGPNILVYHSTMWIKEPHSPTYVVWHQDGTYFFLDPRWHITAWVALSDVTVEAGCMHVIPGSHRLGQLPHCDAPARFNMIRRGQAVHGFDDQTGVPLSAMAGTLTPQHTELAHSSKGNNAGHRRIGFGISYIPTSVRSVGRLTPSALPMRGADAFNHFVPEQRLARAGRQAAYAAHREANARFHALQDQGFVAA